MWKVQTYGRTFGRMHSNNFRCGYSFCYKCGDEWKKEVALTDLSITWWDAQISNVTHPELRCTLCLEIIRIKKNLNVPVYTSLGVMTRETIIEVDVTEAWSCLEKLSG
ncbi:unnamed protein product [Microthlaspi erraticum]|uniref:Uncharacterized protein n=1 Tax=Microthlaspi erraticum TaxID=1685480 RepID=A0A6D2JET4_9BRAS|nr:unnamed protein product [Microthlaspi erraticum]